MGSAGPVVTAQCPECVQEKPWNCTGWAIDKEDRMVECIGEVS